MAAAAAGGATPAAGAQSFYFAPLATSVALSLSTPPPATVSGVVTQPIKFQTTAPHAEVSQVSQI